ncbi:MAG: SpoIID/LytB domain-containing protein [Solirubrobacteraceae bacterium]
MTVPYLTASRRRQPRTLLRGVCLVLAAMLLSAAGASAATTFLVRGGGYGHGIGMSQYGAYGYAQHGRSYSWILGHYYQGTQLGQIGAGHVVRVLLASGPAGFSGATEAGSKTLSASVSYTVTANADGTVKVADAAGKKVLVSAAPLTVTGPGPLQAAGAGSYRGSLEFRPDGAGGIETIEAVGLDDYVRGVISAEVPSGWPAEALKAQAVAARTYAITTNVGGGAYDLYADTRSQMYRGVAAETAATDAAANATAGQVVTFQGAPVVTYFFSSSGGHTENLENVWPGATLEPWLRGVPDPYDGAGGNPYHRWGSDLSLRTAEAKLGGLLQGALLGITVTRHGSSPRILSADVVGTGGRTSVSGIQLQHAFGLASTYASFTTISTIRAAAPAGALLRRVRSFPFRLRGSVFPAPRRGSLVVQVRHGAGWRAVTHTTIDAAGRYDLQAPAPGTYRVVYGTLAGPAVTVS